MGSVCGGTEGIFPLAPSSPFLCHANSHPPSIDSQEMLDLVRKNTIHYDFDDLKALLNLQCGVDQSGKDGSAPNGADGGGVPLSAGGMDRNRRQYNEYLIVRFPSLFFPPACSLILAGRRVVAIGGENADPSQRRAGTVLPRPDWRDGGGVMRSRQTLEDSARTVYIPLSSC